GPEGVVFEIEGLERVGNKMDTQVAELTWNRIYTGYDSQIRWEVWLAPMNSNAYQFKGFFNRDADVSHLTYNLVLRDLQPGAYTIKVRGHVRDANDAEKTIPITIPGAVQNTQILIR
ncbi:MAG: hypothetical protein LUO97_04370, partial [Methanomicrobiales archaeon]|nr:hypothetical protein [Methanomicrobiales archaeon]